MSPNGQYTIVWQAKRTCFVKAWRTVLDGDGWRGAGGAQIFGKANSLTRKQYIYNIRTYCIVYGYSAPRYYKIGPGVAAGDGGGGGREDAKRTGGERPTRTNS